MLSRALRTLSLCSAGMLVSLPALAGSESSGEQLIAPASPVAAPLEESAPSPRFRFGVGGEMGFFGAPTQTTAGLGLVGLYTRLGVQINDDVGIHITGAASTVIVRSYVRAALVADFALNPSFSIGTGLTAAQTSHIVPFTMYGGEGWLVGVPLTLNFFMGGDVRPRPSGEMGITFTLVAGYADVEENFGLRGRGFGASGTLSIGYERR